MFLTMNLPRSRDVQTCQERVGMLVSACGNKPAAAPLFHAGLPTAFGQDRVEAAA